MRQSTAQRFDEHGVASTKPTLPATKRSARNGQSLFRTVASECEPAEGLSQKNTDQPVRSTSASSAAAPAALVPAALSAGDQAAMAPWPGRDGEDAAADAALAGQADAEGELAAIVVMAAQHHHAVDPPRPVRRADLRAGLRIAAVEGEEAGRRGRAGGTTSPPRIAGNRRRARSRPDCARLPKLFMNQARLRLRAPVSLSDAATSSSTATPASRACARSRASSASIAASASRPRRSARR